VAAVAARGEQDLLVSVQEKNPQELEAEDGVLISNS
jgi:hypothetical protein